MEAQAAAASLSSSFSVNNGIIPYHFCRLRSIKSTNARIKSPIPFSVRAAAVNNKDNGFLPISSLSFLYISCV